MNCGKFTSASVDGKEEEGQGHCVQSNALIILMPSTNHAPLLALMPARPLAL